ncbi:MAG: two-component regulator propeller domain-containing protein [Candidatus Wallbacteria bacterium]|nr:two-component regulator propeller domain-containing protein [Candidatus Wallbacteria bacterium]
MIRKLLLLLICLLFSGCGNPPPPKAAEVKKEESFTVSGFFNTNSALTSSFITSLYYDSAETLWIGTKKGLFKYQGEGTVFEPFEAKFANSLTSQQINCIVSDKNGTLFVGTEEEIGILNKITGFATKNLGRINCLYWSDRMRSIYAGMDNGVAIFDFTQWFYWDKENSFLKLREKDDNIGQNFYQILSMDEDSDGIFWIGTGDGLVKYNLSTKEGRVFYGIHKRPNQFGGFVKFEGNSPLSGNIVNSVLISERDKWISTGCGLSHFQNEDEKPSWEIFTATHVEAVVKEDGRGVDEKLPGNSPLIGNWVKECLHRGQWFFIATTGGLSCYNSDTKKWINIGKNEGLKSERLTKAAFYKDSLFVGSEYGLYKIELQNFF